VLEGEWGLVMERRPAKGPKAKRPVQEGESRPDLRWTDAPSTAVAKRGFRPLSKKCFAIIHVRDLNRFPKDTVVEPELLLQAGLLRKRGDEVKLLSDGELEHPLTIRVHHISKNALKKVEAAAGKVEVIAS